MADPLAELHYAPAHEPPFAVEAVIVEEDTGLVLSAATEIRAFEEHPIRLMTAMWEFNPETPGTVVVKGDAPVRLYAIVHDFDREPACREEWVTNAMEQALIECRRLGVRALATQVIGAVHGPFDREWFVTRLQRALWRTRVRTLERIWVIG